MRKLQICESITLISGDGLVEMGLVDFIKPSMTQIMVHINIITFIT